MKQTDKRQFIEVLFVKTYVLVAGTVIAHFVITM
jgi:hypothetical protein